MLTRQIEKAQRKVEAHNFDIRKQLLEFDDVANDQRKVIYQQRTELMGAEDLGDAVARDPRRGRQQVSTSIVPPESHEEMWDMDGLGKALDREFGVRFDAKPWCSSRTRRSTSRRCARVIGAESTRSTRPRCRASAPQLMRHVEKDDHAPGARPALARAPRRDGLSAPGHPPARLRAEGIRSKSTSAKRSSCSPPCSSASSTTRSRSCRRSRSGGPRIVQAMSPRAPDPRTLQFQHAAAPSLVAPPPRARAGGPPPGARAMAGARLPQPASRRAGRAVRARAAEGRPQRAVPVRLGQEIQALPRPPQLTP